MNKFHKYSLVGVAFLALASCAVPKVNDIKKPMEIPVENANQPTPQTESISLKEFFADPELQILFDEVVAANPDFQIAQQRLEIANSFLQRSKMALLPSLEVGAVASVDHYGKYTTESIGNRETNATPGLDRSEQINENLNPNYWLGARSSWEIDAWGKLKSQKLAAHPDNE